MFKKKTATKPETAETPEEPEVPVVKTVEERIADLERAGLTGDAQALRDLRDRLRSRAPQG